MRYPVRPKFIHRIENGEHISRQAEGTVAIVTPKQNNMIVIDIEGRHTEIVKTVLGWVAVAESA